MQIINASGSHATLTFQNYHDVGGTQINGGTVTLTDTRTVSHEGSRTGEDSTNQGGKRKNGHGLSFTVFLVVSLFYKVIDCIYEKKERENSPLMPVNVTGENAKVNIGNYVEVQMNQINGGTVISIDNRQVSADINSEGSNPTHHGTSDTRNELVTDDRRSRRATLLNGFKVVVAIFLVILWEYL
ncbi:hypothetical protein PNOK_0754600 [Pyrrhoderma noxium]|uniref:Uncharacterized protein n=1 Tax=Pyrrhoderma noxium TaxID=2282107 RepID=A0A286UCZ3_9AGAM|nr:hypothetical protein PNOK_0754600 [Pyrrhoderma noxium]